MARLKDLMGALNDYAPFSWQESYDNSGLIVGDLNMPVKGVLCCLDVTEQILQEAIDKTCNVIVAHHPVLFKAIKGLTYSNDIQRIVAKAIKEDIALVAFHTNLDNAISGVNGMMAKKIGLLNTQILSPKQNLYKLSTFVPEKYSQAVKTALFSSGAGKLGDYKDCSFTSIGQGSFTPLKTSNPFVGKAGKLHKESEQKVECVIDEAYLGKALQSLFQAHPYEQVAYDLIKLQNTNHSVGAGMVGDLPRKTDLSSFLNHIKKIFKTSVIKYSGPNEKKEVERVALCGGSGFFLLDKAIQSKADVFVTSDVKYHDFFQGLDQIHLLDIGHYESEEHTIQLIHDILSQKFSKFAILLTEQNTNPVNYYL